jgi:fumarate hydratase class II
MINKLKNKENEFKNIFKIGKTHLQDAVEISFGEEFSGYRKLIEICLQEIQHSLKNVYSIGLGGTAVGTGLNTLPEFGPLISKYISQETNLPFKNEKNKFALMTAHNSLLECSDSLKLLATNIIKISNDIILMNSGPKSGFKQITIDPLIPGSSIMPGKVNPAECEASIMASIQVISNNLAITIANSEGKLELNVCKPLIGYNIIQSINILTDICYNLTKYCISTIKINKKQNEIDKNNMDTSIVTKLSKIIGYDKSSDLYEYAIKHNIPLKQANNVLHFVDNKIFEKL